MFGIDCAGTATVQANTVIGNAGGGINLLAAPASSITKNKVNANGGEGIHVSADSPATAIVGNTVTANRSHGIAVASADAGTRIGKNVALRNGGDGIAAASGVTDLGGNKAHDNAGNDCTPGVIACP